MEFPRSATEGTGKHEIEKEKSNPDSFGNFLKTFLPNNKISSI